MRTKLWRLTAAAGVLVGLVGSLGIAYADLIPVGKAAPTWSAKTLAGKPISSAQFKGKPYLLNFFAYG